MGKPLLASELIELLQRKIKENGDQPVQMAEYEYDVTVPVTDVRFEAERQIKPGSYSSKETGKKVLVLHSIS